MQTEKNEVKATLSNAELNRLMKALSPEKAKGKQAKAGSVKANVASESKTLLALPKPSKKLKNGVFAGALTELGKVITKPAVTPPAPPSDELKAVLLGLGVRGNPIKQVAKRCTGMTSAATIWGAIDQYRAANGGMMPTAAHIDGLKLMCVKRGEMFESRVKLANIKCELWAYACYYQIGGALRKPGQKKAN